MIGSQPQEFSRFCSLSYAAAPAALLLWMLVCVSSAAAQFEFSRADLTIAGGCDSLVLSDGMDIDCNSVVVNRGPDAARDVFFIGHLPANIRSASLPPHCALGPFNTYTCRLGDLRAGEGTEIPFQASSPRIGTFRLTGSVISLTLDPDYGNNTYQAIFGRQPIFSSPGPGADLVVDLFVRPSNGNQLFYHQTVTNQGPGIARGVTFIGAVAASDSAFRVMDIYSSSASATCNLLNAWAPFNSLGIPTQPQDRVNSICTLGDLLPGDSVTLTFYLDREQPRNQAILNAGGVFSSTPDLFLANNEAVGQVPQCRLPGDVNNDGRVDLEDATILSGCLNQRVSQNPACGRADVNGDGIVDGSDVALVNDNIPATPLNIPTIPSKNPGVGFVTTFLRTVKTAISYPEPMGATNSDMINQLGAVQGVIDLPLNAPRTNLGGSRTEIYPNVRNNDPNTLYGFGGAGPCQGGIIAIRDSLGIKEFRVVHIDSTNDPGASLDAVGPFPPGTTVVFFGADDRDAFARATRAGVAEWARNNPSVTVLGYHAYDNLYMDRHGNLFGNTAGLPVLNSLNPTFAAMGQAGFRLEVEGEGFTQASVVQWNGLPRPTTFIDAAHLAADIPASDLTAVGTVPITVNNLGRISNALDFNITSDRAATSTTISSNLNPSTFGGPVTLTATVTSGSGTPDSGTVIFRDGETTIGVGIVEGGKAVFVNPTLSGGSHSITGEFSGNSSFSGSTSPPFSQTVNPAGTSTSLNTSQNPSSFGQPVMFAINVASPAGTPSGSVTLWDGTTVIGMGSLDTGGQATFTISSLTPGSHSVTAAYAGNSDFGGSTSDPLIQTVNFTVSPTTTTLSSSLNPSTFGDMVTLTGMVIGSGGTPTGILSFLDGTTVLATASLDGGGQASLTISDLGTGSHAITAVYGGDSNFGGSTSPVLMQTVDKADPNIRIDSTPNPSSFGQSVTLTGSLFGRSGTPTPTGNVKFLDGSNEIGTVPLDGNGQATLTVSTLTVGIHPITLSYAGDTNYNDTALTQDQVVNKADTAISLSSSPNPSTQGEPVTFIFSISSSGGTPTGALAIYDGETAIGTALLSDGTFSRSNLAVGTHNITVVYEGNADFNGSESNVVTQVVVSPPPEN